MSQLILHFPSRLPSKHCEIGRDQFEALVLIRFPNHIGVIDKELLQIPLLADGLLHLRLLLDLNHDTGSLYVPRSYR